MAFPNGTIHYGKELLFPLPSDPGDSLVNSSEEGCQGSGDLPGQLLISKQQEQLVWITNNLSSQNTCLFKSSLSGITCARTIQRFHTDATAV